MFFRWCFNSLLLLIVLSCQNEQKEEMDNFAHEEKTELLKVKYAKHFGIIKKKGYSVIYITANFKDTNFFECRKPFERMAVMGSIPVFQIYLLNALRNIIAIDDIKYYNLNEVNRMFQSHQIAEIMPNLQWNYEQLILLKPDLLITYSDNDNIKLQQLLQKYNIHQLFYLDYLEDHPLGRAEWIKVLGCILNKDSLAEKIFSDIEKKYFELKSLTDTCKIRPKVLTEVMYGDVWYIAGKQSYITKIIEDAGGRYVFEFHDYENSRPYSFEYVLKYAQDADYWIHLHQYGSLQDLKKANAKYSLFRAFHLKNCFNNNLIHNKYSYNDFYESGICQPHLILSDLISILHPAILPQHQFHYYYQLPEK